MFPAPDRAMRPIKYDLRPTYIVSLLNINIITRLSLMHSICNSLYESGLRVSKYVLSQEVTEHLRPCPRHIGAIILAFPHDVHDLYHASCKENNSQHFIFHITQATVSKKSKRRNSPISAFPLANN